LIYAIYLKSLIPIY